MALFNLKAAIVPRESRRTYRLTALGVELELAPMTQSNKAYGAEFLAHVASYVTAGSPDESIDEAAKARNRRRDVPLMAKHVLVGWTGVTDEAGVVVPFSPEKAGDFLLELATTEGAEYLFDEIRAFARNDDNFTHAALSAARALAGNSHGG